MQACYLRPRPLILGKLPYLGKSTPLLLGGAFPFGLPLKRAQCTVIYAPTSNTTVCVVIAVAHSDIPRLHV